MFSSKEKIKQTFLTYLPFVLLLTFWLFTVFTIPTFDLDESLYRRAAEEMKRTGNYWLPTWDGVPLFHKPPILYWLMILTSYIVDGVNTGISTLAARIPSLLCSFGILATLYSFSGKKKFFAPLLYCAAFFPVLTGTAVIFDPLQTFLFLPFLVFATVFFKTNSLTTKQILWMNLSIFLAAATKGLNGIILPGIAFTIHSAFVSYKNRNNLVYLLRTAIRIFIPSLVASLIYYLVLDAKMGRAFTEEFFFVHHFGRSQNAMEMHGGGFLYHPLFLWISSGFLGLYLIPAIFLRNWDWKKLGFPLTFALSFVLVFSFSATKLPHYTWPAWAALAFQGALIEENSETNTSKTNPKFIKFITMLSCVPLVFWTLLFSVLALAPYSIIFDSIQSEQIRSILKYFSGINLLHRIGFAFCAALSFSALLATFKTKNHTSFLAISNLLCCLTLGIILGPIAKSLLFEPQEQIAHELKNHHPSKNDCIFYAGPHSPTISLNLGYEFFHNRCKDEAPLKYLVVPEWKLPECKERGLTVLAQAKYLYLCSSDLKN